MTPPGGLYVLVDPSVIAPADWGAILPSVLGAGVALAQLRCKGSFRRDRKPLAEQLQRYCAQAGVPLIINDDTELARETGAAGVHLGQADGDLKDARQRLGAQAIIGRSCGNRLELVGSAAAQGADYASIGALFRTQTKCDARPAELSQLRHAVSQDRVPICAIGGINISNLSEVIPCRPHLVAVCGAIFAAPEPAKMTRLLVRSLRG